ncbi:MAG TPA: hypothetical protein VJ111_17255 [Chitinophagaceae bacterium]|nr:hypothetical protein [Chitinophagaceae bacterium]
MWNLIFPTIKKSILFLITGFLLTLYFTPLHAQQNIIVNKDNTRPETSQQFNPAYIPSFVVTKHNGYNEIQWSALGNDAIHKFIIEYSFDGVDFLSAGQVLSNNGIYHHKHYIREARPLLYRVRIEDPAGKLNYSEAVFLEGIDIPPVQLYTTNVKGNVVNANAQLPVERVIIVSGNGVQMFAKDINGLRDFIPIAIPSLHRGLYFITFYGNGWKSTSKFLVG